MLPARIKRPQLPAAPYTGLGRIACSRSISDCLREMLLAVTFWTVCFIATQEFCAGCETSPSLTVHQAQMTGVVNQSVLFPVSYVAGCQRYVKISWRHEAFRTSFLIWSTLNVSSNYSFHNFTWHSYIRRTTFFPENASLILHKLQHNDSGVYQIMIMGNLWSATGRVKLTILAEAVTTEQSNGKQDANKVSECVNHIGAVNIIRLILGSLLISLCFILAVF